jgi:hypothetical protein
MHKVNSNKLLELTRHFQSEGCRKLERMNIWLATGLASCEVYKAKKYKAD